MRAHTHPIAAQLTIPNEQAARGGRLETVDYALGDFHGEPFGSNLEADQTCLLKFQCALIAPLIESSREAIKIQEGRGTTLTS